MSDLVAISYTTILRITKNEIDTWIDNISNGQRKTTAIANSDGDYLVKIGSIVAPWLVQGFTTTLTITEDNDRTIFDATFGRVRQTYVLYAADGSYTDKHGSILLDAKTTNAPTGWV